MQQINLQYEILGAGIPILEARKKPKSIQANTATAVEPQEDIQKAINAYIPIDVQKETDKEVKNSFDTVDDETARTTNLNLYGKDKPEITTDVIRDALLRKQAERINNITQADINTEHKNIIEKFFNIGMEGIPAHKVQFRTIAKQLGLPQEKVEAFLQHRHVKAFDRAKQYALDRAGTDVIAYTNAIEDLIKQHTTWKQAAPSEERNKNLEQIHSALDDYKTNFLLNNSIPGTAFSKAKMVDGLEDDLKLFFEKEAKGGRKKAEKKVKTPEEQAKALKGAVSSASRKINDLSFKINTDYSFDSPARERPTSTFGLRSRAPVFVGDVQTHEVTPEGRLKRTNVKLAIPKITSILGVSPKTRKKSKIVKIGAPVPIIDQDVRIPDTRPILSVDKEKVDLAQPIITNNNEETVNNLKNTRQRIDSLSIGEKAHILGHGLLAKEEIDTNPIVHYKRILARSFKDQNLPNFVLPPEHIHKDMFRDYLRLIDTDDEKDFSHPLYDLAQKEAADYHRKKQLDPSHTFDKHKENILERLSLVKNGQIDHKVLKEFKTHAFEQKEGSKVERSYIKLHNNLIHLVDDDHPVIQAVNENLRKHSDLLATRLVKNKEKYDKTHPLFLTAKTELAEDPTSMVKQATFNKLQKTLGILRGKKVKLEENKRAFEEQRAAVGADRDKLAKLHLSIHNEGGDKSIEKALAPVLTATIISKENEKPRFDTELLAHAADVYNYRWHPTEKTPLEHAQQLGY